jgi:steroid 5-alpha reductase family enzyme
MSAILFYLIFVLLVGLPVVFLIGCIGYIIALWKKDNGVADILYGWHFVTLAILSGFVSYSLGSMFGKISVISMFFTFLVCCWGMRLSVRIYFKNKGKREDFRYATWRNTWHWFKLRSFFQIYLLQGIIALFISIPVILVITLTPMKLTLLICLGVILWVVGFLFELVGDLQLDRFMKNTAHKGMLLTKGLWKYSRHPNYFGEALLWWGFWVVSLSEVPDIWYITIISPLLITFLLLKVSGVPLLEARMSQHADWKEYARITSVFVPWFPKKFLSKG